MFESKKSRESHDEKKVRRKGVALQKKANNTGLPDALKSGVESLSGHSMDDVKVHYNSSKPAQLNAHAYAQGTEIHLASGQEKHLPHEAWHVVQQKEGRVKSTTKVGGVDVNDNAGLEKEADVMGAKALNSPKSNSDQVENQEVGMIQRSVAQLIAYSDAQIGKLYYVEGQNRKLTKKYSGWLKFEGLTGAYRASEVSDAVNSSNGSSSYVDPYSDMRDTYSNWSTDQQFEETDTPFGVVNSKHNRKAPYITTNVKQYPKTKVKVDYVDIIKALKKQKISDEEISQILLQAETDKLTDPNAIRAAAMLIAIVYLAEEWRKQGAVKIFRSILRLVQDGTYTLNDIPTLFKFVESAQDGREQVQRIWEIFNGKMSFSMLNKYDQDIIGGMSPMRSNDMDSDDDMRDIKEDDFVNGRDWSKYGKPKKSQTIDYDNIFKVSGTFFNIADERVDGDGHCAWDTLNLFGVSRSDLQAAAISAGVTYNDFVDIDELKAIVNYLNNNGYDLKIRLVVFGYDGSFIKNDTVGNGSTLYTMGLVINPSTGLGHYVPSIN